MLVEYALVPDIFDSTCYNTVETCDVHLQYLKEPLLQDALVRDLRNGGWSTFVRKDMPRYHLRAKELIRKLISQNRLCKSEPIGQSIPTNYMGWCNEALASHKHNPLNGIIASSLVAAQFKNVTEVASIEKLYNASWWQNRSPSIRLNRNTNDYIFHLKLILNHGNSLMFVDPHIDPGENRYGEFIQLLKAIRGSDGISPRIEIHRVCYKGSGANRKIFPFDYWEMNFKKNFSKKLTSKGLSVEVFIWDDFHDRYLITDILGIAIPNGFDISNISNNQTTWTKLGRRDRDDIQREFDPSAGYHDLKHRFRLP